MREFEAGATACNGRIAVTVHLGQIITRVGV